nr:type II secretion system F family protein [Lysobacter sp. CAU 1642]
MLLNALGGLFARRIDAVELGGLLRDLGVMLGAGVPMLSALDSLIEENRDTGQHRVARVAQSLSDELGAGASISEAFGKQPNVFPETVLNLVNIGQETGAIDRMLIEAAEHVERVNKMGRDARRALIYPAFVVAALLLVSCVWIFYVIPNLADLYRQMNIELPAITAALLDFSEVASEHVELSLFILFLLIVVPIVLVRLSWRFRSRLHGLGHRLPVSRVIMRASGMAFITEHLALLVAAGLDMSRSLDVLTRSVNDEYYRSRIIDAHRYVQRGERLAAAMKQVGGFPAMAVRMIAVGEETGTTTAQLRFLAQEYRQRFDHIIESLAEVLKPAIIITLGLMFVLFVVAMYLPIYDLIRQAMAPPAY